MHDVFSGTDLDETKPCGNDKYRSLTRRLRKTLGELLA